MLLDQVIIPSSRRQKHLSRGCTTSLALTLPLPPLARCMSSIFNTLFHDVQLGGAMRKFKGLALQNLEEIHKSMEAVEGAAEAIMRNIPAMAAGRQKVIG